MAWQKFSEVLLDQHLCFTSGSERVSIFASSLARVSFRWEGQPPWNLFAPLRNCIIQIH